ncbi:uncharacterized protein [Dermacentor albipictus]|uniref:uncharacterized protein n=1 Tax=Dermacentor albipictus TaxID=60249 RepID=UPI0031FC6BFD
MTSEKMQEWPSRIWGSNVDDVRRLLVLDQVPIHKTQAAKNAFGERNSNVVYVLAGCMNILLWHPAGVYGNKPFKSTLQRLWEEYMCEEERTPKGNLKKQSRQHALDFVAEAAVPEETVARSFKGCSITNALDGSEDSDLHVGLSDVGAVAPEDWGGLQAKCYECSFATDSEKSFNGFESD